jgi:cytochrome P450 family 135
MATDVASPSASTNGTPVAGLPPGPRTPAFVNTSRFLRRPLETLDGWHREYGDFFTVRHLMFGTGVYVVDPEAIRSLMTGDQSDLHAGEANEPLSPVLGPNSVLILDGAEHMRQRKLLLPPFQGSAVNAFREVIRDVARAEVARWRPGDEFPMRERMRALTFEVICRAVFGVTEPDRIERLRDAIGPVMDTGSAVLFLTGSIRFDLGPLSPWGRLRRRLQRVDALLYEEIERRRGQSDLESRTDVLSILLRARDEDGNPMSDAELRDELMTMLAAGHETTATALAFAFELLLRHPHALGSLREELATGDDAYLKAVVTESLRIRPVIDGNERTLTKPRVVGDWELPAGIRVYPAIVLVQRREDLFEDAGSFRPERFLDGAPEAYTWLPFGGGIRRCIGAHLAQAEMAEVIRVVVASAELEPLRPEPDPVVIKGITLAPRYGAPVRVL